MPDDTNHATPAPATDPDADAELQRLRDETTAMQRKVDRIAGAAGVDSTETDDAVHELYERIKDVAGVKATSPSALAIKSMFVKRLIDEAIADPVLLALAESLCDDVIRFARSRMDAAVFADLWDWGGAGDTLCSPAVKGEHSAPVPGDDQAKPEGKP